MSDPQSFHDGRVVLHAGDCLEALTRLEANSVDSVVTDPPYHLTSIVKRFGGETSAAAKDYSGQSANATGAYARASRGFMGKTWDGGDIAFRPELWREVLRVLKPGGHVLAFSGTRTYHRMACAIEDAGFEIRDQIHDFVESSAERQAFFGSLNAEQAAAFVKLTERAPGMLDWAYGSGFPKSHDVSKAIDKHGGKDVSWFGVWLRGWRQENGVTQKQVAALFPSASGGLPGCVANWELGLNLPTPEQFNAICDAFNLPFESLQAAEREIVGQIHGSRLAVAPGQGLDRLSTDLNVTAPATDAARAWEGWGTALKPAIEPICMARKPLSESSVAANVLRWNTGAIHVEACKVAAREAGMTSTGGMSSKASPVFGVFNGEKAESFETNAGRWPANLVHDGSADVVDAFPDAGGGNTGVSRHSARAASVAKGADSYRKTRGFSDSGSAARFFYSGKANSDDRLGSKHPTVKPVDLMRWLVRLVTPSGGLVLDPFAGTGTTAEAALREGFRAVLIEREAEYRADIARRMVLVFAPARERREAVGKGRAVKGGASGSFTATSPRTDNRPGRAQSMIEDSQ